MIVRDVDLFAFAHAADGLAALAEPHAGESRTLKLNIPFPFPFRPSDAATPFVRAYASTRIHLASTTTFATSEVDGTTQLEATIETGAPEDGKGFLAVQVGLTYDEPDLDNYCPPGTCDLDGLTSVFAGQPLMPRLEA